MVGTAEAVHVGSTARPVALRDDAWEAMDEDLSVTA